MFKKSTQSNHAENGQLKAINFIDKILATASVIYGILGVTGVLQIQESWWNNPLWFLIGGTASLVISIFDLPQLFLNKMRRKMVVSR